MNAIPTEKPQWAQIDTKILPAPWKLENFTESQLSALKDFKTSVQEYLKESHFDLDLIRWLIARDWNVVEASKMFIESQKWRSRMRADYILEDFPRSPYYSFLCKYYPSSLADSNPLKPLVRTRDGQLLIFEKLTAVDPAISDYIPMEELYRYHIWCMEKTLTESYKCYQETGSYAPLTVLLDIDGIGLHHVDKKFLKVFSDLAKIDSDNYPETLRKVILVNVPPIFSYIWSMCHYFLDDKQKAKLLFCPKGTDYQTEFSQICHPSCYPKSYGGSNDYTIPSKLSNIKLIRDELPIEKEKIWEKVTVSAGSFFEKDLEVTEPKSYIKWQYKTKDYDIKFGLKYQSSEKQAVVDLLPAERIESFKSICHGSFNAQKPGIYKLYWDNTYSWKQSKELTFTISAMNENGECFYDTEKLKKGHKKDSKKDKKKETKKDMINVKIVKLDDLQK